MLPLLYALLQPDNIYEFGAQFFAEMLAREQAKGAGNSSGSSQKASKAHAGD